MSQRSCAVNVWVAPTRRFLCVSRGRHAGAWPPLDTTPYLTCIAVHRRQHAGAPGGAVAVRAAREMAIVSCRPETATPRVVGGGANAPRLPHASANPCRVRWRTSAPAQHAMQHRKVTSDTHRYSGARAPPQWPCSRGEISGQACYRATAAARCGAGPARAPSGGRATIASGVANRGEGGRGDVR
jgi:hypothetical protein